MDAEKELMKGWYRTIAQHLDCTREIDMGEFELMIEVQEICDIRNLDIPRPGENALYPVSVLREAVQNIVRRRENAMKPRLNIQCGFVEGTLGDIIENKDSKSPLFHLIQEAFYLGKFSESGREYRDKLSEGWNRKRLVPVEESIPQEDTPAFDLQQIITLFGAMVDHTNQLRKRGDFLEHLEDFSEISKIETILLDMARRLK